MELLLFLKLMSDLTPAQAKGFLGSWLYLETVRGQCRYQPSLNCGSLCLHSQKTEMHRELLPSVGLSQHLAMPPQALAPWDGSCLLP